MKTEIVKAFVIQHNHKTEYTEESVLCLCFELNEMRLFNINFFKSMKLFKGKNVWFEIKTKPGTMITSCYDSKQNKFKQLWNYYIKRKFTLTQG